MILIAQHEQSFTPVSTVYYQNKKNINSASTVMSVNRFRMECVQCSKQNRIIPPTRTESRKNRFYTILMTDRHLVGISNYYQVISRNVFLSFFSLQNNELSYLRESDDNRFDQEKTEGIVLLREN